MDGVFRTHGAPIALKHDWGPEFTSGAFQAMSRGWKAITLPNPPYWPRSNGKLERGNRDTRQWLLPFVDAPLSLEEFAAMRLSAMAVLQERGLLRYFKGRRGPEV